MNDFPCCSARPAPSYLRYGIPSPASAVRRRLAGPLDEELVALFDQLATAAFAVGRTQADFPGAVDRDLGAALRALGVFLLGSHELVSDVLCSLGDGPAEGDLFGALGQLWDEEIIDLGPALVRQLRAHGVLG